MSYQACLAGIAFVRNTQKHYYLGINYEYWNWEYFLRLCGGYSTRKTRILHGTLYYNKPNNYVVNSMQKWYQMDSIYTNFTNAFNKSIQLVLSTRELSDVTYVVCQRSQNIFAKKKCGWLRNTITRSRRSEGKFNAWFLNAAFTRLHRPEHPC